MGSDHIIPVKNAIAELIVNILKNKESGKTTISLFLDLSKAFNSL